MRSTVAGVFRDKANGQNAVAELLSSGFVESQIDILSEIDLDDYRGQATSAVIRPRTKNTWLGDLFRSLTGKDDQTIWEKAYSQAMKKGFVILTVEADTEKKADRAAEILNKYSPLEVEEFLALPEVEAYFAHRRAENRPSSGGAHAQPPEMTERDALLKGRGVERRGKVHIFPSDRVP